MGKTVFLSASVPTAKQPKFLQWGVRPRSVDEAVTSLTVALLRRRMRMVFGGHPSISPLVAMAALQYQGWNGDTVPIVIYQSEAYRGLLPDETWRLFRSGVAEIVWTEKQPDDDERNSESLRVMRQRMLSETKPAAMVCMGGMQGVVDEVAVFQDIRREVRDQVHLLAGTGGATAMLALERSELRILDGVQYAQAREQDEADMPIPYPFLLARLADVIAGPDQGRA